MRQQWDEMTNSELVKMYDHKIKYAKLRLKHAREAVDQLNLRLLSIDNELEDLKMLAKELKKRLKN